jgi:excisionase family DNA binding protein
MAALMALPLTDSLLTTREAAAYLRVCEKTLLGLVRRGLPCVRLSARGRRLFEREDLVRWVDAHRRLESTETRPTARFGNTLSPSLAAAIEAPRVREIARRLRRSPKDSGSTRTAAGHQSESPALATVTPFRRT